MTGFSRQEIDDAPLHGYRGELMSSASGLCPAGLTICLSREAGARGGSIARRLGQKLGWHVFDQDQLEYLVQDGRTLDELDSPARNWVNEQFEELIRSRRIGDDPHILDLAKVVLALAASGEAVLVGRGAGCVLPSASTLNVRIVAPRKERVAYMAQWLRLSEQQADEAVRLRDAGRAEYLDRHFGQRPDDVHAYDLVLNSSQLGESLCAELIAQAAKSKFLGQESLDDGDE